MRFKMFAASAALALAGSAMSASPAQAQAEPFIGQVVPMAFNFCPRGWLQANGSILPIAQNTALFSLLGTMYGGNGQTTFALPDLRGRVAISLGQGPGLPSYVQGETGGAPTATLLVSQMPSHTHTGTVRISSAVGESATGVRNFFAQQSAGTTGYTTNAPANFMRADSLRIDAAGGGQPFSIRDPYLVLNYCIATQGIFPSRP